MASQWQRAFPIVVGALSVSCDIGVEVVYDQANDDPPSVEAFSRQLAEGRSLEFLADLNKINRSGANPDILAFLRSTWLNRDSELASSLLADDLVAVELANTLAQANRNGYVDLDERELHRYVRSKSDSEESEVRRQAIIALSIFDDPLDVPTITGAARSTNDVTFRLAIIALARMCAPEARSALDALERTLSQDRLQFLQETTDQYDELKSGSGLCSFRSSAR